MTLSMPARLPTFLRSLAKRCAKHSAGLWTTLRDANLRTCLTTRAPRIHGDRTGDVQQRERDADHEQPEQPHHDGDHDRAEDESAEDAIYEGRVHTFIVANSVRCALAVAAHREDLVEV